MVINEFTNSKPSDFAKKYGTKTDTDVKIEQNLKKKFKILVLARMTPSLKRPYQKGFFNSSSVE